MDTVMKLSRTVAYALQATLQLAQADGAHPVPCSRLAADGAMPERFLLQILRSLVTHGILQSTRGVVGGYTLVRPPEEISILEIIEAIEGPMGSSFRAAEGLDVAHHAKLQSALQEVAISARRQLGSIKLSEMVRQEPVESN
jgi:Rrf2 family protein